MNKISKIDKLLSPETKSLVDYCMENISFEEGEFLVDSVSGGSACQPAGADKEFCFVNDTNSAGVVLTSKRIIILCRNRKTEEMQTYIRPVEMVENVTYKSEGIIVKNSPIRIYINGTNFRINADGGEIPEEFVVNINKYAKLNRKRYIPNDSSEIFKFNKNIIFCIKCGTKLPRDANYCFKCGVKVEL